MSVLHVETTAYIEAFNIVQVVDVLGTLKLWQNIPPSYPQRIQLCVCAYSLYLLFLHEALPLHTLVFLSDHALIWVDPFCTVILFIPTIIKW